MSPQHFVEWLDQTPWSIGLHESVWAYPIIESVHVLVLCLFLGMAFILDLRLLGISFKRAAVSEVAQRLLPWTIAGFVVMVVTGVLLFVGIPLRTYHNIFFRVKVIMLILAGMNTWVFHSGIFMTVADWDRDDVPPLRARMAGAISLFLWTGVVIAGRFIAYNWFDKATH